MVDHNLKKCRSRPYKSATVGLHLTVNNCQPYPAGMKCYHQPYDSSLNPFSHMHWDSEKFFYPQNSLELIYGICDHVCRISFQ